MHVRGVIVSCCFSFVLSVQLDIKYKTRKSHAQDAGCKTDGISQSGNSHSFQCLLKYTLTTLIRDGVARSKQ